MNRPNRIPAVNARPKSKPFKTKKTIEVHGGYRNTCLWCGVEFDSTRPAKYDGQLCRTRAYQARQQRLRRR